MYQLVRTLPDGTERRHTPVVSIAHAAVAAGLVLYDNARVVKREAQRFSRALEAHPLGEELRHHSGYAFRIEAV